MCLVHSSKEHRRSFEELASGQPPDVLRERHAQQTCGQPVALICQILPLRPDGWLPSEISLCSQRPRKSKTNTQRAAVTNDTPKAIELEKRLTTRGEAGKSNGVGNVAQGGLGGGHALAGC